MVNVPEAPDAPDRWNAFRFDPEPADPLSSRFHQAVRITLDHFLDGQRSVLAEIGPELAPVLRTARTFTSGGKRLRPAFCLWGYVAAGGDGSDGRVLRAAASLDLLHVSALVHDDLMDASDTRRGVPSAHRQLEALHRESGWQGSSVEFGRAGAVVLGDLLLMWSVEMLHQAAWQLQVTRVLDVIDRMRTEVTAGQYLDVLAQASPVSREDHRAAVERAHRVVEFKSARYTVGRPLQFGALLAGAGDEVVLALEAYGSHVGRAFQFRDDVLGVFGDEAVTGKPAGDDLREGKQTLLLAEARVGLSGTDLDRLDALVGDPGLDGAGVADARGLIEASGARDRVDQLIEEHGQQGLTALDGAELHPDGRTALRGLADAALRRDS